MTRIIKNIKAINIYPTLIFREVAYDRCYLTTFYETLIAPVNVVLYHLSNKMLLPWYLLLGLKLIPRITPLNRLTNYTFNLNLIDLRM